MEYGLWNLPTGFWQAGNQNNLPVDSMGRPYYAPANGLPSTVFHGNLNDAEMPHYAVTNSQSYRQQTEYLAAAKNGTSLRPVTQQDDKSHIDGLMPLTGETIENYSAETMPQQVSASPLSEDVKDDIKIKSSSPVFIAPDESNGLENKTDPTLEYLKQQSYHHPMYGMIFSQMTTNNKPEQTPSSDNEDDDGGKRTSDATPSVFSEGSQPDPCRTPEDAELQSSRAGYECGECGLVAETRPSLKKHISQAHPDPGDQSYRKVPSVPNSCPMASCRFRSDSRNEMEAHVARHVSSEGFNPNGKKKACPVALQRVRYEREEYRCQMCSYSCTIEKAFYKHLKVHTLGLQSGAIKISCVICGKDRTSEVDMNKHMKKHRDDRYFCCDICIFKTVQLKKLIQHRRMHTGEKPHLCPHCSYRSARRDNLRSHVRRVHKKDNLFCDTFSPRGLLLSASVPPLTASPVPPAPSDSQDA